MSQSGAARGQSPRPGADFSTSQQRHARPVSPLLSDSDKLRKLHKLDDEIFGLKCDIAFQKNLLNKIDDVNQSRNNVHEDTHALVEGINGTAYGQISQRTLGGVQAFQDVFPRWLPWTTEEDRSAELAKQLRSVQKARAAISLAQDRLVDCKAERHALAQNILSTRPDLLKRTKAGLHEPTSVIMKLGRVHRRKNGTQYVGSSLPIERALVAAQVKRLVAEKDFFHQRYVRDEAKIEYIAALHNRRESHRRFPTSSAHGRSDLSASVTEKKLYLQQREADCLNARQLLEQRSAEVAKCEQAITFRKNASAKAAHAVGESEARKNAEALRWYNEQKRARRTTRRS